MGHGVGAGVPGGLGEAAGDQGAAEGGGEGVLFLVYGAGLQAGEQEFVDQRLACVDDEGFDGADG